MSKEKTKGITLIALIITIIVMLILVGVTVTVSLNGGLFKTAQDAVDKTHGKKQEEVELSNGRVKIGGVWYDSLEAYERGEESVNQKDATENEEQSGGAESLESGDIYTYGDYKYIANGEGNWTGFSTLEQARNWYIQTTEPITGMSWNEWLESEGLTEDEVWEMEELTEELFVPFVVEDWSVQVIDTNKTHYGDILESINGKPVTDASYTFKNCTSLTSVPKMPDSITNMEGTFQGCTSLTDLSDFVIPSGVTKLWFTFQNCSSLTDDGLPKIPNGIISLDSTFKGCSALTDLSNLIIPNSVTSLSSTFESCLGLSDASNFIIPQSVTNIDGMFMFCTNLTKTPQIPSNITSMQSTFAQCNSLYGTVEIPCTAKTNSYTASNKVQLKTYHYEGCGH